MLCVARLSLPPTMREESRGTHHRRDFPERRRRVAPHGPAPRREPRCARARDVRDPDVLPPGAAREGSNAGKQSREARQGEEPCSWASARRRAAHLRRAPREPRASRHGWRDRAQPDDQKRAHPDGTTFVGKGKAQEVAVRVWLGATMVMWTGALTQPGHNLGVHGVRAWTARS
jgi:hypothetical protein